MKIKTKKTMKLPQLIEWAWENGLKGEIFSIDQNEESGIYIATNSDFMLNSADFIRITDTFTVEVEEEITEDTEFKTLIEVTEIQNVFTHINTSINEINHDTVVEIHALINGRLNLIWTCEKGLVD